MMHITPCNCEQLEVNTSSPEGNPLQRLGWGFQCQVLELIHINMLYAIVIMLNVIVNKTSKMYFVNWNYDKYDRVTLMG